jgi:hypothetical protein
VGASSIPAFQERLTGLRLACKAVGLAAVEAPAWTEAMADPTRSKPRLMAWLMIQAARSEALAAPRPAREAGVARGLAMQRGVDFDKVERLLAKRAGAVGTASEASGRRWFGLLGPKAPSAAPSAPVGAGDEAPARWEGSTDPADIADEAAWTVARRERDAAPIAGMLASLEASEFERAQEAFASIPRDRKIGACAALLGCAKMGFWDRALPASVGDEGRNPLKWAGFKIAVDELAKEGLLDARLPKMFGLNLLGVAAAVGYADACSALIRAGARLDPNPLTEEASALCLALTFGHSEIARALLSHGADPLEGAVEGILGFERKAWAIHAAFDAGEEDLVEAMLEAAPAVASAPNLAGHSIFERARKLAQNQREGGGKHGEIDAEKVLALAERALLRRPPSPGDATPEQGPRPRRNLGL